MIVLDQNRVVETHPMVDASTGYDCVFVEHTKPGHCLARVRYQHTGPLDRIDEHCGSCGDTRHTPEQVESRPLAGENRTGVSFHHGEGQTGIHSVTVDS